jgi:hypothetical protein
LRTSTWNHDRLLALRITNHPATTIRIVSSERDSFDSDSSNTIRTVGQSPYTPLRTLAHFAKSMTVSLADRRELTRPLSAFAAF